MVNQKTWFAVRRGALAALLLAASIGAQASDQALAAFTEKMQALETLEGDFEQLLSDPDGAEIQRSAGHFVAKRPGYFLWEVNPPYEQLLIGTPQEVKIYDPDLEQLTVQKHTSLNGSPAVLISGDVRQIAEEYLVTQQGGSFALRPKQLDNSTFASMVFRFDEQELRGLSFVDKLGQTTEITFSKLSRNAPVADSVFAREFPPDTDIIFDD